MPSISFLQKHLRIIRIIKNIMNAIPNQKEFLSFFPHTRFRYIHDVKKDVVQGNDVLDLSLNKKGYGVFFSINGFPASGKADESQLLSLNANYTDFDVDQGLPQDEKDRLIQEAIMAGITAGALPPTIINRTQKGAHLIWIYLETLQPTPENLTKWKSIQKRLVRCFNGDTAAVDSARVLRLPYTLHLKDPENPFEIKIISYKPEAKYTLDELDITTPQIPNIDKDYKMLAKDVLHEGINVGKGLRHMAMAQVAGLFLKDAINPEQVEAARLALYWWDREVVKSPEQFEQRKKEIDNTIDGILKRELNNRKDGMTNAVVACLADVQSSSINWLWFGRIALGKITLIAGDPSLGKSLLTTTLAAYISKGYKWPLTDSAPTIGDVLFLSAEDDVADTIKPRLEAAEADCRRVHILQAVKNIDIKGSCTERMFSLRNDLPALERLLSSMPNCRLLVIDPISAYLDDTESHNNSAVRGLLAPLAALATKYHIAVILVSHLNKGGAGNALYRPMGSLAFIAAARSAYIVAKDKNNPDRRLFLPAKNNIAKDNTGLGYSIITAENGAPIITWEMQPIKISADEALAIQNMDGEQDDTDEAIEFLRGLLSVAPMRARECKKEATEAGISEKSLRRAREKLGIKPKKVDFNAGWQWALPKQEDAQDAQPNEPKNKGIFDNDGHLRNKGISDMSDEEWFNSL